jgi:diguanylate cyclase (GGDEF)-like protein
MQNSPDINNSIRWKVKNELMNFIYPNLLSTLPTLIFIASILVYKLKGHISPVYLISWLCVFLTVTVCQGFFAKWFDRNKDNLKSNHHYSKLLIVDATLVGLLWGTASILLMPADLIGQSYLIVILLFVAAGGPLYLAGSSLAGSLYASCTLVPLLASLIISFISQQAHHEVYFNLTLAVTSYWALLLIISHYGSKLYREVMTLTLENTALSDDLAHANAALEKKDFASMTDAEKLFETQTQDHNNPVNLDYELEHATHHDELTGLDTHRIAEIKFIQSGAYARRHHQKLAVIRININNLNEVDPKLGKKSTDRLLKTVAVRLQYCKRETDILSRLDKNEFVLIMSEISIGNEVMTVINKILKIFAEKTMLTDNKLQIDASLGISIYPNDGADLQSLIKTSDIALSHLYNDPETRTEGFVFYDAETMGTALNENTSNTATPPSPFY